MREIKFRLRENRIAILVWSPAAYDHDDGYYEVAHIKMSKSKNSYMNDWNLDEVLANIKVKESGTNE